MRRATLTLLLGALVVAVMAVLTIGAITPPDVRGLDAPATDFSAVRARVHVEAIAKTPHPVGSPAHEEVRAYVLRALEGLHLEVRVQETHCALKAAAVTHAAHVKNVIARLPGTRPGPAVMLAAHYDSVAESRGASDDGSGVATLLETARALAAGPRMQNDVLFLFSDAEEMAGCGALAFTDEALPKTPVGVAMNFEARGTRGAVALYDTSEENGALIRALAAVAPRVVSTSLLGSLARALPNDSDATLFKRAGIPTFAFAYVDHVYQYHQYTDSLDALDLRSLQHDGDYALPLARYFGDQALPLPSEPAVTYFDLFGRAVVSYSTLAARALGFLTLASLLALLVRARREGIVSLGRVVAGAAVAWGAVLAAGLAAVLAHLALRAIVDPFVLTARPWLATTTGLAVGLAALLLVFARSVRDDRVVASVLGALSVWAFFLALTCVVLPVASFVFQWPLAFALAGTRLWLPQRQVRSARVDAAVTLALVPAAFFWGYLGYTIFVMVGGRTPEAVVVAGAVALLLALPAAARLSVTDLRRFAAIAFACGVGVALVGAIRLRRSADLPRPDSLVYELSRDHHLSRWITTAKQHDAYVTQRIPEGRAFATAELFDLAPLETSSTSVMEGALRHATLHVASPRRARCVRMWEVSQEPIVRARVGGRDVVSVVRFSEAMDEKLVRLYTGGHSQAGWVMEECGADEKGFDVELFTPSEKPIPLRIIEYSDGLPGPALLPRTPSDGYPASASDETEVTVNVKLWAPPALDPAPGMQRHLRRCMATRFG